ncbi:MAG: ABC transporter permease [Candidatus Leucobacter sulfamidivorax]|nr:ABC transporter permease [Candidatus Leucobacter sulfamidivorax]
MLGFILRRVGLGLVMLFAAVTLMFFLVSVNPESIARTMLGGSATPDAIADRVAEMGLDRPIVVRYGEWLLGLLRGDLGESYVWGTSVNATIAQHLPVTLSIVIGAVLVTAVLAVLLGTTAALRRGWIDRLLQLLAVFGTALPGFLVALLLVTVFAIQLQWFPAIGYTAFAKDPRMWALGLVLPVASICVVATSAAAMQMRAAVIEVGNRDFVRTLRSRGFSERRVVGVHVLRAAAPVVLSVLSLQFVGMLSGVVVVEQIFALQGIGSDALNATTKGDVPVVLGVIVVCVVIVVLVNLAIDLLNAWINPKVRLT